MIYSIFSSQGYMSWDFLWPIYTSQTLVKLIYTWAHLAIVICGFTILKNVYLILISDGAKLILKV